MSEVIRVNKFNTKTGVAYESLKRDIADGKYRPGEKLTISQISKELHISDIPVREALNRLESEGLVENTPHVGYKVTHPEFDKFIEVFEVRQLLEGQAAALAAKNIAPEALQEMARLLDFMGETTRQNDMDALTKLNYQFHHIIYSSCGNGVLTRLIEQVWAIYPRTRSIFIMIPERAFSVLPEHEEIYKALKNGDAERAREALLRHKQRSYDLLVNYEQNLEVAN
ncbi:MAG: GntR family transcriptional regulator [Desulfarculus sp.]|jgi:DNA-binding GntR family transcriptional regulator|nr:MAG: GntR family transcriptional regulator [Desulfarculus sp.]